MTRFRLAWSETYDFEQTVEADSLDKAIAMFKEGEINFPNVSEAGYQEGSCELNKSFTEAINDPVTGVKPEFDK
jgi:hypothetical protein